MMDVLAGLVVVATFYFIVRGAEVRLALLAGGAVLAAASLRPEAWFTAFGNSMAQAGLLTVILPAIGFTSVIKLAGCDRHLVRLVVGPLLSLRAVIVPAAMLATLLLSTAITSAAGITAAVGVVLIPAMIALGVHPAMAAAAVIAGTWGAAFSPGSPHPALIGQIAERPVIEIIVAHAHASVPAALTMAFALYLVARLRREDAGWTAERAGVTPRAAAEAGGDDGPVRHALALLPLLPLALLLLSLPQLGLTTALLPQGLSVLQAMVIGTVATAAIARLSPAKVVKSFFDGMGEAYAGVIGIIIAAGVFIGGLNAIGSIDRMIDALQVARSAVPVVAMAGTFAIAVLSGSGDAAALAFNKAVLPQAESLGMEKVDLGNIAWLAGGLGRAMSPVAAATAIAAGYAGVGVFDIARRTAAPALLAATVVVAILGFLG
ncbi:MAG: C4-dicarboxylate transporter DcuC [Burkholderiaceae bacterium]|jgi:DcuC family C4-dicarboxylate transporter|nr:C4-dicarboxylate transporter DcuC [Burkholderiaceae bacterium]